MMMRENYNDHTETWGAEEYMRAGFWMRLWAYATDLLVTGSLSAAILGLYFLATGGGDLSILTFTISGLLSALITFGYFILMTKLLGQTLGKMVFGIRVLSREKSELSWLDVIFREFVGRFLHRFLFITNLLYLIVAFHPEKRGLHDFLGNSIVVLEKRSTVPAGRRIIKTPTEKESDTPVPQ
ncbi:RDD family protein [Alkalicoccus halolimnae]|uniref:RDD family protein n=1 Tax=Alkalicoccus halolimnae TaxID=1667239 RepID=A0AAJ8N222_9BACI|nr:RDD family protein [Alkalicoccus halolimnae]